MKTTTPKTIGELFTIGRRISYTGDMANPAGQGAIVAINEANPAGRTVDIILEDGREKLGVLPLELYPAAMREGCRYRFLVEDDYADTFELADLRTKAALLKANKSASKALADQAFSTEVARIQADYPTLAVGTGRATAAANLRKLLRAAYPGVKFSVHARRCGFSSAIDIAWTDGPTSAMVDTYANRFKSGNFDGMDDCYHYAKTPWNETFGHAEYVSCSRDYSDALVQRAIDALAEKYGHEQSPTVTMYREGNAWGISPVSGGNDDWQSLINMACASLDATGIE